MAESRHIVVRGLIPNYRRHRIVLDHDGWHCDGKLLYFEHFDNLTHVVIQEGPTYEMRYPMEFDLPHLHEIEVYY